jgi:cytochrome c556
LAEAAAGMRDLIGRAGHNCKVGTDASYGEAKLRKDDLENLVRGNPPATPANIDSTTSWKKVSDRPPLMTRIEKAQQQGVTVWTANAGDFKKNSDQILHEAQVIAAIAEVIQRDGFEFADDETYLGYARQMRDQAVEVVNAVKSKNYEQARKAAGQIDKACSGCHEGYRS